MNARQCWVLCSVLCLVLACTACGDDDGVTDSGLHDAMPDSPIEAGTGACDGPFQHPLYVMPFEGTCFGPERAVPDSCVTGIEGMTGHGELWCFTSPEGVLHASLIQFGEQNAAIDPGEFGGNPLDAGDVDAGDPNEACARALSRVIWIPDADAGFEDGEHYYPAIGHLPFCSTQ